MVHLLRLRLPLRETYQMIETLLAATVIGQTIIGPNLIQTEYLTERDEVITIVETIQEVPN